MLIEKLSLAVPRASTQSRGSLQTLLGDVERLLTHATRGAALSLAHVPEVERSVLNYGAPSIATVGSSNVDPEEVSRKLMGILQTFDERLDSETLKITRVVHQADGELLALMYDVGCFLKRPVDGSDRVTFRVVIDCSSGAVRVKDVDDERLSQHL